MALQSEFHPLDSTPPSTAPTDAAFSLCFRPCTECANLAAEVERFKEILCVAETALSKLQTSVVQEENRWRTAIQDSAPEGFDVSRRLFHPLVFAERQLIVSHVVVVRAASIGISGSLSNEVVLDVFLKFVRLDKEVWNLQLLTTRDAGIRELRLGG